MTCGQLTQLRPEGKKMAEALEGGVCDFSYLPNQYTLAVPISTFPPWVGERESAKELCVNPGSKSGTSLCWDCTMWYWRKTPSHPWVGLRRCH